MAIQLEDHSHDVPARVNAVEYWARYRERQASRPWWHFVRQRPIVYEHYYRVRNMLEAVIRTIWLATAGRWLFIKRGNMEGGDFAEAATLQFIRRVTTIPVPKVWGTLSIKKRRYTIMSRVSGHEIARWEDYDEKTRDKLKLQLQDIIRQLRSISPPPNQRSICSILGGPVLDLRLCSYERLLYVDEDEMNLQIRCGEPLCAFASRKAYEGVYDNLVRSHSIQHAMVFTHGDFTPRNILVDGDRISGVIDWECSGWFPAHWEHLKACFGEDDPDWQLSLGEFMPLYPLEIQTDRACFAWGARMSNCIHPPPPSQ